MVKAKVYNLVKYFEGFPKKTDLELVEEELRPIETGEFLAKAIYLSVDPYMRALSRNIPLGQTMIGTQVARIIQSKHCHFPEGKLVVLNSGWRTHTISNGKVSDGHPEPYLTPDIGDCSPSVCLGVLGMPGNTAYFLFLKICNPNPGETVVVTSAGGAVGSVVGQIAKIKGCTVIGITGTEEKGEWITKDLGFDHFINYKTKNINEELIKLAPQGIDCFFDTVGGETAFIVMKHMKLHGRVAQVGSLSSYNEVNPVDYSVENEEITKEKELTVQHGTVYSNTHQWLAGIYQLQVWMYRNQIRYRETITEGFENMFDAFLNMLHGGNIGKAIVKV